MNASIGKAYGEAAYNCFGNFEAYLREILKVDGRPIAWLRFVNSSYEPIGLT
jgi:hypothetical protein